MKQKLKKKPLPKKLQSPPKKPLPTSKEDSMKSPVKKSKPMPSKMKKAKVIKKSPSSNESSSDNDKSDHESTMPPSPVESKPVAKKFKKQMIEKIANTKTTEVKEVVVRKRMASLNASAMMAATYEVERHLDKCEAKMYKQSAETTEMITVPKKSKEIKDEVVESKDVSDSHSPNCRLQNLATASVHQSPSITHYLNLSIFFLFFLCIYSQNQFRQML